MNDDIMRFRYDLADTSQTVRSKGVYLQLTGDIFFKIQCIIRVSAGGAPG